MHWMRRRGTQTGETGFHTSRPERASGRPSTHIRSDADGGGASVPPRRPELLASLTQMDRLDSAFFAMYGGAHLPGARHPRDTLTRITCKVHSWQQQ